MANQHKEITAPALRSTTARRTAVIVIGLALVVLAMGDFTDFITTRFEHSSAVVVALLIGAIISYKFGSTKVVLTLGDDGIRSVGRDTSSSVVIPWDTIEECHTSKTLRGYVSIHMRLKPKGERVRYDPRNWLISQRTEFEEFVDALNLKIEEINRKEASLSP